MEDLFHLSSQRLFLNIAHNSNCLLLSISSLPELASHHPSTVIFFIFLCEEIPDFFPIFNQNSLIFFKIKEPAVPVFPTNRLFSRNKQCWCGIYLRPGYQQ
ncbi:hypothetical protein BDL97_04G049800 [Sphagnum fallax]|nr:hypothetical protein BDL97_04G049800 [Sphagnum fallax]